MIEGMNKGQVLLLLHAAHPLEDGGQVAMQDDLSAVMAGGIHFGAHRVDRHHHRARDPGQLGCQGGALGMVAGAHRADPAAELVGGEGGDSHQGAAQLEGAGALEQLFLEKEPATEHPAQPGGWRHRGAVHLPGNQFPGLLDGGELDQRRCVHGEILVGFYHVDGPPEGPVCGRTRPTLDWPQVVIMLKSKDPYKDPLVAGMLALIPGAGHLYCGESLRGVTYLAGTVAGLFLFVVPGVFIWAASIPDVVLCVRRRNRLRKHRRSRTHRLDRFDNLRVVGQQAHLHQSRDQDPPGRVHEEGAPEDRQGITQPVDGDQGHGVPEDELIVVRHHALGGGVSLQSFVIALGGHMLVALVHQVVGSRQAHQALEFLHRPRVVLHPQVEHPIGPDPAGGLAADDEQGR